MVNGMKLVRRVDCYIVFHSLAGQEMGRGLTHIGKPYVSTYNGGALLSDCLLFVFVSLCHGNSIYILYIAYDYVCFGMLTGVVYLFKQEVNCRNPPCSTASPDRRRQTKTKVTVCAMQPISYYLLRQQ